jgi:hypothetical protein
LPRDYFAGHLRVLTHLRPIYKGNRFHVAKKKAKVEALAKEFANVYHELMNFCDAHSMQASIVARAEFENEPIDALYSSTLYEDLNRTVADYKLTGRVEIIRDAIDSRIARSLRSVDGLLAQGETRRLPDGGIETQIRTIAGVRYSVRAWNDRSQRRRLHVSKRSAVEFDLEPPCLVGRFRDYTFAIPD